MDNQNLTKCICLALAVLALFYIVKQYSKKQDNEQFYSDSDSDNFEEHYDNEENHEEVEGFEDAKVKASEASNESSPQNVDDSKGAGEFGLSGNQYPKDCFPKDQLTPGELLPGDANSKWAQSVPAGQGELGDQNFLTAGYHIGVNTVGQTLRNANRQLRSEPPNPQVKVSPWMQTTIEADTNRKPLEIGGCE